MVSFTATTLLSLIATLSLTSAMPSRMGKRYSPEGPTTVTATLIGAAGAQYELIIPIDGGFVGTGNALSISHIETTGSAATCTFYGIDGSINELPAQGGFQDVGPPQTIASAVCTIAA